MDYRENVPRSAQIFFIPTHSSSQGILEFRRPSLRQVSKTLEVFGLPDRQSIEFKDFENR